MDKPQVRTTEYLDFLECKAFIADKLGYDLRDTMGWRKLLMKDREHEVEYRDWWHHFLDYNGVKNDSYSTYYFCDMLEEGEDWQKEITQAWIDEFGEEGMYWMCW